MSPKAIKITYWIITLLFVAFMLFGGVIEVLRVQSAVDGVVSLGYPVYFLTILGIAKILGSIAIVQTKFKKIKEWAYAGFTFDIISASMSLYFTGSGLGSLFPIVFLVVLFISYRLDKKIRN